MSSSDSEDDCRTPNDELATPGSGVENEEDSADGIESFGMGNGAGDSSPETTNPFTPEASDCVTCAKSDDLIEQQPTPVVLNSDNYDIALPSSASNCNDNRQVSAGTLLDIASHDDAPSILQFVADKRAAAAKTVPQDPIQLSDIASSGIRLIEIINDDDNDDNAFDNNNPCNIESSLESPRQKDDFAGSEWDNDDAMSSARSMHSNNNNLPSFRLDENDDEQNMDGSEIHLNVLENIEDCLGSATDIAHVTMEASDGSSDICSMPTNGDNANTEDVHIGIGAESQDDVHEAKLSKPAVTYYCTDLSNLCENIVDDSNDAHSMFEVYSDDEDSVGACEN